MTRRSLDVISVYLASETDPLKKTDPLARSWTQAETSTTTAVQKLNDAERATKEFETNLNKADNDFKKCKILTEQALSDFNAANLNSIIQEAGTEAKNSKACCEIAKKIVIRGIK